MIANRDRSIVVSSLGWIDHDAIWRLDVASGKTDKIQLNTGAKHASLHHSGTDRFAVVHHFEGVRFVVTVRSFAAPAEIIASATLENGETKMTGDASAWQDVPRLFVEYLSCEPWKDFVMLTITNVRVTVQRLEWYDDSYDKGYEGVTGVVALADRRHAIVSVQRRGHLILHDLETGRAVRKIPLANRGGGGQPTLRQSGRELWATDYDSLVVVDTASWSVIRSKKFQEQGLMNTRQFIGSFSFAPDEDLCVLARPFSGDVIGVDPTSLKTMQVAKIGRQPLQVMALPDGVIVAQEWKTGELLQGKLESTKVWS